MTTLILLLTLTLGGDPFVVHSSAQASYQIDLSREALRGYVDDIGLFTRNMPGVVEVTPVGDGTYLYRTEKDIPLSGTMRTDFLIAKHTIGDSVTTYESIDPSAENHMVCRVTITPAGVSTTTMRIELSLRLTRENASDVHWLAPILGAGFISDQMTRDLEGMLAEFIERSNAELYGRLGPSGGSR